MCRIINLYSSGYFQVFGIAMAFVTGVGTGILYQECMETLFIRFVALYRVVELRVND